MDDWKRSFLDKLHRAQDRCARQFEQALDDGVVPAFEQLAGFLGDNGFNLSTPLRDQGRRSFKFELAENAYFLVIFRFTGVGEFELRCETFAPGAEPILEKSIGRVADIDEDWARQRFQTGLDNLVDLLAENAAERPCETLAAV